MLVELERLHVLMRDMLIQAAADNWERVSELDRDRRLAIDALGRAGRSERDRGGHGARPAEAMALVEEIRRLDAELIKVAVDERDRSSRGAADLQRQKRQCTAYLRNGG
ncbi:MAG: hypothetical protein CSB44_13050 [Gammaproteobacteria bacterium]|nr:MAG: hypothetical protein CSB44_13050 [Gammaproteobacteria bacterium]PIE35111.1 MAG: hypothetical protein CSA54_06000 [Gammaproteobacteria bacterium]